MTRLPRKSRVFFFIYILYIFYFIQISSFIHFHHTHSEDGLKVIVSVHPVDHHTAHHDDHHSGDHHHQDNDHLNIDLTFIKSKLRIAKDLSTRFHPQTGLVAFSKPSCTQLHKNVYSFPSPRIIFSSSILSRSPPYLT